MSLIHKDIFQDSNCPPKEQSSYLNIAQLLLLNLLSNLLFANGISQFRMIDCKNYLFPMATT